MDYGARFNSDIHGLGKYDTAAIRFGYGQLIDLIPDADGTPGHGLRRRHLRWTTTRSSRSTRAARRPSTPTATVGGAVQGVHRHVDDRVPAAHHQRRPASITSSPSAPTSSARTCSRGTSTARPGTAAPTSRRSSTTSPSSSATTTSSTPTSAGAPPGSIDGYLNRLQERYFNRYSEAFQFFFFLSDYLTRYDLGDDLFLASVDSLNALARDPADARAGPALRDGRRARRSRPSRSTTDGCIDPTCACRASPSSTSSCRTRSRSTSTSPTTTTTRSRASGRCYEKLQALSALTSTESRFFRVDELSDVAAARRSTTTGCSGTRWSSCSRASSATTRRLRRDVRRHAWRIRPTSRCRSSTSTTFGMVEPADAALRAARTPSTSRRRSTRPSATGRCCYGLGRLGSSWDSTLDFQNFLAIGVKGADDDFTVAPDAGRRVHAPGDGDRLPRADQQRGAAPNIGKQLLDELNAITGVAGDARDGAAQRRRLHRRDARCPTGTRAKADLDAAAAGTDQNAVRRRRTRRSTTSTACSATGST